MTETLSSQLAIALRLETFFTEDRARIVAMRQRSADLKAGRPTFIADNTLDACRDYDAKLAALDLEIEHAEAKLKQAEAAKRAELEANHSAEQLNLFSIQRIVQLLFVSRFNVEYEQACHKIVALIEAGEVFGRQADTANNENRPKDLGEIPTYLGTFAHLREKLQLPHRDGGMVWKNGALRMPFADGYDPVTEIVADIMKHAAEILKGVSPADLSRLGIPLERVPTPDMGSDEAEPTSDDAATAKPGLGRRLLSSLQRNTAATAA